MHPSFLTIPLPYHLGSLFFGFICIALCIKIFVGQRVGYNNMIYSESEIDRIARVAGDVASKRGSKLCSVDKANVLDVSQLWRDVVTQVMTDDFPEIELSHMYVDNAAMQLIRWPKQFDTIVCGNIFGMLIHTYKYTLHVERTIYIFWNADQHRDCRIPTFC